MSAPDKIKELTKHFQDGITDFKSGNYNEARLRIEFLNPFFKALGWDVDNEKGYAEGYKEVIHEDSLRMGKSTKNPDYSFRVGGTRKFVVEAKKPSVRIKDEIDPAFQLRSYAWTAGLPLSILTDFEEFSVYDCRIKPFKNDKASVARIAYFTFDEYDKKWEEIAGLFSPEAILKGSFDRYAKSDKGKKGTSEVDSEFLKEIEGWREKLAKSLATLNKNLDLEGLNHSVQLLIDRIIFLRIAEAREVEEYKSLLSATVKDPVYRNLNELFIKADEKYNSGLFEVKEWVTKLKIDDDVLKSIITGLYYPDCPYEFSVLPIEILGSIYERFLGKTIRLTASHQAKIEEKEEVRKAGGVYYTPKYIVEYIVQNTVGEKVKELDLYTHPTLRILDPACGSGSFLVGAYSFLLQKYLETYTSEKYIKKTEKLGLIYPISHNAFKLTIEVKQQILIQHIFGVDIDPQAVEVTKLSLLLKLMEDENLESAEKLFKHSHIKVLPDLKDNIKCGNSLIGSDFYAEKDMNLFGNTEMKKVNVFDWEKEFPEVFKSPLPPFEKGGFGFDVVIGNPPYVRQETLGESFKKYAKDKFKTYAGTADLYVYFIEKSLSLLDKDGLYSMIVANKWMRAGYGESLRRFLKEKKIHEIIDFGDLPVFQGATTYPCILKVSNAKPSDFQAITMKSLEFPNLQSVVKKESYKVSWKSLDDKGWSLSDEKESKLLDKIKKAGVPLGEYAEGKIYRGVLTGLNEAFVIDEKTKKRLIQEDPKSAEVIKPFLAGKDIKRYCPLSPDKYLLFTRRGIEINKYPAILKHLEQFKEQLKPKPKNWPENKEWKGRKPGSYEWYEVQDSIDYYEEFEKEKIIYPNILKQPEFTYDKSNLYTNQKCFIISQPDKYLLGILNSRLNYFLFEMILPKLRGGFFEPSSIFFLKFPIPSPTENLNPPSPPLKKGGIALSENLSPLLQRGRAERRGFQDSKDRMVSLVDQMLETQKNLHSAKTDSEKGSYQKKIEILDKQIDTLVYELYGLTDDEIAIVEGAG